VEQKSQNIGVQKKPTCLVRECGNRRAVKKSFRREKNGVMAEQKGGKSSGLKGPDCIGLTPELV